MNMFSYKKNTISKIKCQDTKLFLENADLIGKTRSDVKYEFQGVSDVSKRFMEMHYDMLNSERRYVLLSGDKKVYSFNVASDIKNGKYGHSVWSEMYFNIHGSLIEYRNSAGDYSIYNRCPIHDVVLGVESSHKTKNLYCETDSYGNIVYSRTTILEFWGEYDFLGRPIRCHNSDGSVKNWYYDNGELSGIHEINKWGRETEDEFHYNTNGQLISHEKRKEHADDLIWNFNYDSNGKLIERFKDMTLTQTYNYEDNNLVSFEHHIGKIKYYTTYGLPDGIMGKVLRNDKPIFELFKN